MRGTRDVHTRWSARSTPHSHVWWQGGGGSSPTPIPPTILTDPVSGKSFIQQNDPYSAAYDPNGKSASQQLNEEIEERQRDEKAKSDQAALDKKTSDDLAESTFQTSKGDAYNIALQRAMKTFSDQGLDPNKYLESDIKPELQRNMASIKDLDPNPTAAFAPDLGQHIIDTLTGTSRTNASTGLNKVFTPQYSATALPDSLIGNYADTLLNEQFNPLAAQLENAHKRGTLSDVGYAAATDTLGQKRTIGSAKLQELGSNILAGDRKGLDDYAAGARTDVSHLGLSDTFDPNTYATGAQGKVKSYTDAFGGDLRDALGATKFTDLNELINAGGAVQGAGNPTAANPVGLPTAGGAALSPTVLSDEELAKQKRGLGSTGAF